MIYFDNAATGGRKPDSVINAVTSSLRVCANAGRSSHKLALSCANIVQECREELCNYLGGYASERCVFTKNCSEALNIALFGILQTGDHIVTTCLEHNSVLRPLQELKKRGVIDYDVCPLGDGGVDGKDILKRLTPNTKAVVITSCSNVTGRAPNLSAIKKMLPKHILLIVDGAQGVGHLPLHMQTLGIDVLTVAGHKGIFGIQGSGALLFSERVDIKPLTFGGTGSMSFLLDMPDFYPDCLETGTISFPAVVSLLEGVRYLRTYEKDIFQRLIDFTQYLIGGLQFLPSYVLYSAPNSAGIVAFRHKTLPSQHVADLLSSKYDIAVRGGLHCAPLIHEALGTLDDGLVRVSFSHFNSFSEIDVLLNALSKLDKEI